MQLKCGERLLDLTSPRVMGILNITPDSFSDGGRLLQGGRVDPGAVCVVAEQMVAAGAALVDVGGESTRPGADPVGEAEELERVLPVVEALSGLDVVISVDTRKAAVAKASLAAGAHLINDVTALQDPAMLAVAAGSNAAVCLMHMRGEPRSMQEAPQYVDVVAEVKAFLSARVDVCRDAGIDGERILLDPGIGFGKTLAHNLSLLRGQESLTSLGCPLLIGVSRKRMIGTLTGRDVGGRLSGSLAAAVFAVVNGASVIRAHDVAETVDALRVAAAFMEGQ
jgi:dihydropteroate synthase